MKRFWLSSTRMTVEAHVDTQGYVCFAAPIVRVFLNQKLENLQRWMRRQGGYRQVELSS